MELIVRVIIPLSMTTLSFFQHKFIEKLGLKYAASEIFLMKTHSPRIHRLVMDMNRRQRTDRILCGEGHDRHRGSEGTMGHT